MSENAARPRRIFHQTDVPHQTPLPLRVAVYARVSTEFDTQAESLETQMTAFRSRIAARPGWELAAVYAEKDASGTQVRNREEFMRMMADARAGKIDYILTKSVSRFARNTLECLQYVRELKTLGVDVLFDETQLDTANAASEMVLTILAAVAQEESRSISENVKWGRRKRFEAGVPCWNGAYGYVKQKDGTFHIDEEKAETVRYIFRRCLEEAPLAAIARELNARGIPTSRGRKWEAQTISVLLHNEKYIGDVLMQKYYIESHLTHRIVRNNQTLIPSYYLENHHAPIISRRDFHAVQMLLSANDLHRGCVQTPYFGLLQCPWTGEKLIRIAPNSGKHKVWMCPASPRPYWLMQGDIDRLVLTAFRAIDEETLAHLPESEALRDMRLWRDRASEKVTYYFLVCLVEGVTWDAQWRMGIIRWRCGLTTHTPMTYARPTDRPGAVLQQRGGIWNVDGLPITHANKAQAHMAHMQEEVRHARMTIAPQSQATCPDIRARSTRRPAKGDAPDANQTH